ncbi:MAG: SPASM domain-containing protein [Candidatus Thorarchaeota archaeon]
MSFQEENDQLFNSFLQHTFVKKMENFDRIELYLGAQCNQKCRYCYLVKHGKELYPPEIEKKSKILRNLELLCDWMIENEHFWGIDYFAGENYSIMFPVLELLIKKFAVVNRRLKSIVIPTNYSFLLSDKLTAHMNSLIKRSREIGMPIFLSASFDGKYCDCARATRDDDFYNRCFSFNSKWGFGFHPMIAPENIEHWKENWLWFQENFLRHQIAFSNIYLLEVRNPNWDKKQTLQFGEFIEFLIEWTFNYACCKDENLFLNFLFKKRGYNILSNPLTTIGRGLGCSFQSTLYIRVGDLSIVPCHRTSYEPFILGKFRVERDKIVGIEARNPELFIGGISFDFKNQPQCEACLIKHLCSGGCLGSQFETTGDLFSPIPTVCRLEHQKVVSMIKAYKKIGMYELIKEKVCEEKKASFEAVERSLI